MKLITTKQALVEALGIANKAVSSRSSIQVLSGVLIDAREEGITLSATDMEISIKAPLPGRVEQPGSLVVPARIATDIARSLPIGEVVIEQRAGETQVEIRAGESVFNPQRFPAKGSLWERRPFSRRWIEWLRLRRGTRPDPSLRASSSSSARTLYRWSPPTATA
jgi:DNA polymerase III sliding clamp (beta) subunit (PCNA family)